MEQWRGSCHEWRHWLAGRAKLVAYSQDHPYTYNQADAFRALRDRFTGGRIGGSGVHPAMVRAQASACSSSVMPGNIRRNSTTADSSPLCS